MTRHFLTVANTKYYLNPGEDLDVLAQRLVTAARAGEVVELATGEARRLRIVATQCTAIVIVTEEHAEAQPIHPREHVNMLDADLF